MVFRQAKIQDAQNIAQLHTTSWQQNYRNVFSDQFLDTEVAADRLRVWEERCKEPAENQYIMLAEEKGKLLGFCCAYLNEDFSYGTYLDNLHVSSKAKGKGIGSKLIQNLVAKILDSKCPNGFYLWVLKQNTEAIRFYDQLKGAPVEHVIANDIGDVEFVKIRYVWEDMKKLHSLIYDKSKGYERRSVS